MKNEVKNFWKIAFGIGVMFLAQYLPLFDFFFASQKQLLFMFVGALFLWLTVAIDWPSLLLILGLATIPELGMNGVLQSSFGNSTWIFLLFTFVLSHALVQTSFLKRVAYAFLRGKFAKKGAWYFVFAYFLSILFIGSFISPTVLFFLYYPLLEEIFQLTGIKKGEKVGEMLMMGTVIMCGISSGMTPIAHIFPVMAMSLYQKATGILISSFSYMSLAIPIGLVTAAGIGVIFYIAYRKDVGKLENVMLDFSFEKAISKEEKLICISFLVTIFLWIFPVFLQNYPLIGGFFKKIQDLGLAFPPMLATVFLALYSHDGKKILSLSDAFARGVPWSSLIMCAATLAIGSAFNHSDIGLSALLSSFFATSLANLPSMVIVIGFCVWAGIQTNFSSNMVTATVVSSSLLSSSLSNSQLSIPTMIVLIGILSSYAFATPSAMPCVAVATSSGYCRLKTMAFYGFLAMIVGILTAVVFYPIGGLFF